jgi:hypothetical protein
MTAQITPAAAVTGPMEATIWARRVRRRVSEVESW